MFDLLRALGSFFLLKLLLLAFVAQKLRLYFNIILNADKRDVH